MLFPIGKLCIVQPVQRSTVSGNLQLWLNHRLQASKTSDDYTLLIRVLR